MFCLHRSHGNDFHFASHMPIRNLTLTRSVVDLEFILRLMNLKMKTISEAADLVVGLVIRATGHPQPKASKFLQKCGYWKDGTSNVKPSYGTQTSMKRRLNMFSRRAPESD
ncbi:hypothetical protein M404DRAFT_33850 [Pisolithus tinctorius Marx 270]|uniref:Uncharacterized protein n=1 Tax=Pisolithus tinctorius Marx 270 TaxID=870435 RepID=A0A0C3IFI2_PISTI|nr:hypothetical protein M404DRAFT_33850 [Pisolithus tinctorius Marx 270]